MITVNGRTFESEAARERWVERMRTYNLWPYEAAEVGAKATAAALEDEPVADEAKRPGANLPADPARSAREAEAIAWIKEYAERFQRGEVARPFGLLLDLRADRRWGSKWYRLSDRQIEVVLNSKARELAVKPAREQTGRDLTKVLPIGRTAAAVTNDEGHTTFLLIDVPNNNSKWAGWAFVKQFIGGIGEGRRLGSQRPGETYVGQWANLIDKVLEDPMAAVQRFGHELGICGVCMAPLTNEESREFGIGPVCRGKIKRGA